MKPSITDYVLRIGVSASLLWATTNAYSQSTSPEKSESDLKENAKSATKEGAKLENINLKALTKADKERLLKEGLIDNENGECTCGTDWFCDRTNGGYKVKCMSVSSNRCEWFTTSDTCE